MFSRLFINMGIFVNPEEFKLIRKAFSLFMSKYGFTISGGQSSSIFLFDFLCVFLFLNCIQKNRIRLLVQRGRAFLCMFDVRECLADALAAIEIATRSQIFKTTNVLCSARRSFCYFFVHVTQLTRNSIHAKSPEKKMISTFVTSFKEK